MSDSLKYRVAYSHIPNAGDLLNIYLLNNVFHVDVEHSGYLSADMIAIGSSLGQCQYSDQLSRKLKQILAPKHTMYVWGTGFLTNESDKENPFVNKKMVFKALRGELTKRRVEKITGKTLDDIPLCDGGILTSYMFEDSIQKKYNIGIIPHYKEQKEKEFKDLKNSFTRSKLINLRDDPMDVFRQIAECEYIISSSLHGLIIADSFGIPNLHITVTDKLLGDGFKFADYYSGFGLSDNSMNLKEQIPTINDVIDQYRIERSVVETKQKQMYDAFPRIWEK